MSFDCSFDTYVKREAGEMGGVFFEARRGIMKKRWRVFLYTVIAAVILWVAAPACAGIYEGPNGEIYYGDYLPQELYEKGYKPKDPAFPSSSAPSEQSRPRHFDAVPEPGNQGLQNSYEAVEGIDFINTSNYANTRLEFYYYIPSAILIDKRLGTDAFVAIPGLSGRGEGFVTSVMKEFADEENVIIIAPSFMWDQDNWNSKTSYQYPEAWSGDALVRIIDKVNLNHGTRISRLYMYGFSAGAQYVLRFALWKPSMCAATAAHGSGGTVIPEHPVNVQFFISVGTGDTSRIPKAEAFVQKAQSLGIDVTYRQYPVGHSQHVTQIRDSLNFLQDVKGKATY